ncbi:MAG TPA: glycosyltransferase family 4 protein [Chloroflexota bacterium]|nr:glycosyltransferase family 4 protein [Chloroflexota bacterium]
MRVVVVSKAFMRATYHRKLEEMARADRLELTLITPASWREGTSQVGLEQSSGRGYAVRVTPILFNGAFHWHFYPRLAGLLRELRPDVVQLDEEPYNLATWLGMRAARAVGASRLFFTWQDLYKRYPFPFSRLEADNYRLCDGAIAGIPDASDVLRQKGFKKSIWVIPQFGTDPDVFCPRDRQGEDLFRIGYVGRLVAAKGVDLLLHAARLLPGRWQMLLVGSGEERAALERLAADLDLSDRVEFRGDVASSKIPTLMNQLDVLVLPSRSTPAWREQFGRVLIEAMASGVPVVGSSSGQIPYVIGEAGLIFPEGNTAALAEHLIALQQDRERRRDLGERGRQRVLDNFTQQRVAEQTVAVYRAIVNAKPQ